ncbi:MAG: MBL fold metallo-hydrolase [Bacteroidetes bacterium RIFCSPLOWO2_12_FULL_35_15]|nr:MAG: MBL fold metallo-hydrolase [Bacteroidetes bacterium RIFCSPLOWO2_12_FULL_35_15]
MQITFLGTGTSQGVPIIACNCQICLSDDTKDKRLRSSILIEEKGKTFVIDTGPDFRQQMLRENVKKMDAIIFTHEHKDHTAGFDDIRAFNYVSKKKIEVYASANVQEAIKREFAYIFSDFKYPGIPEINLHLLENKLTTIDGVDFIPIEVMHYKLPVFSFRINDFTYITDANYISDKEKEKIKGSKVIVLNALRKEPHISHFTLEQAIELVQELKPEKAYFTHISHQLGLHADVAKELPATIELAYDGLKIQL